MDCQQIVALASPLPKSPHWAGSAPISPFAVGHVLPKINKNKPKGPQRTRPAAASKTKDEDSMTSADKSVGRSRRRAAPTVGSLKEVSTRAKLRQGDPNSSSIYTDFVPGTKSRSGNYKRLKKPNTSRA